MTGGELEAVPQQAVAVPMVDRQLVARDLDRLAGTLTPLMLHGMESLRSWRPRVGVGFLSREVPAGELLVDRLRAFLPPVISGALAGILNLADGELRDACAVIAAELGAWCLANPPLTDAQLAAAAPALGHLLGSLEEPIVPVDWDAVADPTVLNGTGVSRET